MPGDETKNYDLVIEFAEQAYRDLLGTLFDSDAVGSICWILEELRARVPGFPDIPCGTAFIPDVFFDRPTDIALPAGTRDTIDIRVHLGEGGASRGSRCTAWHTRAPGPSPPSTRGVWSVRATST